MDEEAWRQISSEVQVTGSNERGSWKKWSPLAGSGRTTWSRQTELEALCEFLLENWTGDRMLVTMIQVESLVVMTSSLSSGLKRYFIRIGKFSCGIKWQRSNDSGIKLTVVQARTTQNQNPNIVPKYNPTPFKWMKIYFEILLSASEHKKQMYYNLQK